MKVTQGLMGLDPSQKEVTVETGIGGGDCGYAFQRSLDYIVYASKKPGGSFSTGICSPTRRLDEAAEDLRYFHQLADALPIGEIRVTAYDVHGTRDYQPGRIPTIRGLAGVRVTIDGGGVHEAATTDGAGRHIFDHVPPGEYKLDASLEGYAAPDQFRPVQVHSKGCAEVPLPLRLDRRVAGHILSSDGLPVSGVIIECVPTRPRHQNDLPRAADSCTTDANGRYELRHLTTGDYYFGISLSRSPTLENAYTRWFYPGTEDPTRAEILHVADQPEVQVFDLTLPNQQHDRIIQGVVFWPDGRFAEGVNIFLEDPRWPWQTSTVAAITDREGRFLVHALDGTHYRIHAATFSTGPISAEPFLVEPGNNRLEVKLTLIRKGYSPRDAVNKGLDDWRKGLGLR